MLHQIKKMSFSKLVALEKKYDLWNYTLFDYPLWIHCREPLLDVSILVDRKITYPSIKNMCISFVQTLKFLFTQGRYDNVYFLMERAELLEIYRQDSSKKKVLFLNPEQDRVYEEDDYIKGDFFNLLRFLSRKVSYVVFWKKYSNMIMELRAILPDYPLDIYVKQALGDAAFLKFLSLILSKKNKKIYTGSVIPIGEKFINALNSYEVQHGVIHPSHIGYIAVPKVKNTLILYAKRYKEVHF